MVVYWLYNVTGEPFLLELAELIHKQTFPYTDVFLNEHPAPSADLRHLYPENVSDRYPFDPELIGRLSVDQFQSFHCVNLRRGLKSPLFTISSIQTNDTSKRSSRRWRTFGVIMVSRRVCMAATSRCTAMCRRKVLSSVRSSR